MLSDRRVFVRETDVSRPGFAVDLLLDASSSRMHCQEAVAAQGYILTESLARCGIPVRVSGFCSLRGYTVLRVLKGFGDGSGQVFRYFAAGWNRDGLVLRALRRRGLGVGAVFMGPGLNAPAAETIYGESLARIRSMDQLASAAGRLIRAEIQELE